jgi:hypothetical protein
VRGNPGSTGGQFSGAGRRTTVGEAGGPQHDQNHRRKQDGPADQKRHCDALQSVLDEVPQPAAMEAHVGEEAGNQEEGRHSEHVNDKEQRGECYTGMSVLDYPEPLRCRNERHGRVQDNAEQQGESSDRVERVQSFRGGRPVARFRHHTLQCPWGGDCKLPTSRRKLFSRTNEKSSFTRIFGSGRRVTATHSVTQEVTPLRPSDVVNGRRVVILFSSDDQPPWFPRATRSPVARIRMTQSHVRVANKLKQMFGCLSDYE